MGLLNTLQEVTKYNGELADPLSFRQATINEEDWTPNSDWAFREVQLDVTPEILEVFYMLFERCCTG